MALMCISEDRTVVKAKTETESGQLYFLLHIPPDSECADNVHLVKKSLDLHASHRFHGHCNPPNIFKIENISHVSISSKKSIKCKTCLGVS